MVNGLWADFYHTMLDNVNDLDSRLGLTGPRASCQQTLFLDGLLQERDHRLVRNRGYLINMNHMEQSQTLVIIATFTKVSQMLEPMITVLIESKNSAIDKDKFKCRFIGHVFVPTQVWAKLASIVTMAEAIIEL